MSDSASAPENQPGVPSPGAMTIVSLLLFIHGFMVWTALSANVRRSAIQGRLLEVFSPYLVTLGLDPDFTRYHLTHGTALEDDHFWEVELRDSAETEPAQTIVLPDRGSRFGKQVRRYVALAQVMGYLAEQEDDAGAGRLALAVGGHLLRKHNKRYALVRCKQHESQPRRLEDLAEGFPRDPFDPKYHRLVYEAEVFFAEDESLVIVKKSSRRESAGVRGGASGE